MSDFPRNAEDLTEQQAMQLIGLDEDATMREWLEWLMENEMIDVSNLITSLTMFMGEHDLKRCLEVNELTPTRFLSEELLQDQLDELEDEEDDGQPSLYEEMQDYFGGDDNPADYTEYL